MCHPSLRRTSAGAEAGVCKTYTSELKDRGGRMFLTCSCVPESGLKAEGMKHLWFLRERGISCLFVRKSRCSLLLMLRNS